MKDKRIQLLIIVILTILAYSNIFFNGTAIDDSTFLNWQGTHDISNLGNLLAGQLPPGQEGVYRPVRSVLYLIYYYVWGTNVFGYHLHGLLVHLICTVLVFLIIQKIVAVIPAKAGIQNLKTGSRVMVRMTSPREPGMTKEKNYGDLLPFVVALLFGLHPIHTESITYISASMEMTGIVFFLSSFLIFLKVLERKKVTGYRLQVTGWVLAGLAFFTYEVTLVLPLVMMFYLLLCHSEPKAKNIIIPFASLRVTKKISKLWVFFALAGVYLVIRFGLLHTGARAPYLNNSFFVTMATMPKVFLQYIWLLIFPINQANNQTLFSGIEAFVYRGYNGPLIARTLWDWWTVIGVGVLGMLGWFGWLMRKRQPLLSFGIGWFLITLLPAMDIVPQGSILNEKLLYLPSVGFLLVGVMALMQVGKVREVWVVRGFLVIAIIFGWLTFQRNFAWHNDLTLWSADIKAYPNTNAYAYYQRGVIEAKQKDFNPALADFQKAYEINPQMALALASSGQIYQAIGQNQLAVSYYLKALQVDPSFWEVRIILKNDYHL